MNNVGSPQKSDVVHMEASKEQQQRPVLCPSPPRPVWAFSRLCLGCIQHRSCFGECWCKVMPSLLRPTKFKDIN